MGVVDASFGHPAKPEERASAQLAGGILGRGYQCGMLWGAALAAGAQAYRLLGPGPQAETQAITATQGVVEAFRARTKDKVNCRDITGMDWKVMNQAWPMLKYFITGGPIGCFRLAAGYAPEVREGVTAALSQEPIEAPPPPVSCASVLARKMGASDRHAVMAAGFAGGIGLCGGACGALGAAIWLLSMKTAGEGGAKMDFGNPAAAEAVDRLAKITGSEIECSKIVGRRFESVADHAGYLREGGCSKVIEALVGNS